MNKVLEFFKDNFDKQILIKKIKVYGWKFDYETFINSSVTKYLFEDLNIIENIAPVTNSNRPMTKKENKYICVHDTGDTDFDHTAKFWSDVVKVQNWEMGTYKASFQYVTGNDGIYHQIPDDEVAYHAGDGTSVSYSLNNTFIKGTNKNPNVEINENGYYRIDNHDSMVISPSKKDKLLTQADFVDFGIEVKLINGEYYIGNTYYNETYNKIANRGGNLNSIGIESCVNKGSDIYLTMQRTAKLVSKLLHENNLDFSDVKQHHFFSGKNCPQTMRMNDLWDHFISLVKFEYKVYDFIKEGYTITLLTNDKEILDNGRIKLDGSNKRSLSFTIQTELNGIKEKTDFTLEI